MTASAKLARCRCDPSHLDPARCPSYGGRPARTPERTFAVRLTRPMLLALDAVAAGYTVHQCSIDHPHRLGCDGWSPSEARSLHAAYRRLDAASRLAGR